MNVLIVESNAKARTLQKYLGSGWKVLATGGHVETLPDDRAKHGKDATKAFWANRPGELPSPPWVWTDRGEKAVKEILADAGDSPTFWIATDPDREGEFIAWSLEKHLSSLGPTHRITFQEVTKEAVARALEAPRGVDRPMVESALVRKFVDRLVGFRTSSMAGRVIAGGGASMGRVQTPTLGFVVERELEREAHVPIPYFEVRGVAAGIPLGVRFHEPDEAEAWRDETGRVDPQRTFDGEGARQAHAALEGAGGVTLTGVRPSTRSSKPRPPFTTDALLQAAGGRFGWSPKRTSALASILYEAGHITYIRTDSTRMAASAVHQAREVVKGEFGADFLGSAVREGAGGGGPVQDAHEAIRPTRLEVAEVELEKEDSDARRLYRLIRAQTLSSQMAPAVTALRSIEARCEGLARPLTGSVSWETFAGWRAAWREFDGERPTAPPNIPLEEGAWWTLNPSSEEAPNPLLVEDETKPPGRYRPHTLIKAMKDAGIGRPSTYSRTVEKLEEREYVALEEGGVPTKRGRDLWLEVAPLYVREEGVADAEDALELFSPEYTALMEEALDLVESGEAAAPATWERWRDQVRDLHEAARERRNQGAVTPRQVEMLRRLLANAPPELVAGLPPLETLTWERAQEVAHQLRDAGVHPAPTTAQVELIRRRLEELGMGEEEGAALVGAPGIEALGTSARASALIDELQRLHDERRPPSPKQRRFIDGLREEAALSEEEAASLVGLVSLEELTGGREGSASALIELLKARVAEKGEGPTGKAP